MPIPFSSRRVLSTDGFITNSGSVVNRPVDCARLLAIVAGLKPKMPKKMNKKKLKQVPKNTKEEEADNEEEDEGVSEHSKTHEGKQGPIGGQKPSARDKSPEIVDDQQEDAEDDGMLLLMVIMKLKRIRRRLGQSPCF